MNAHRPRLARLLATSAIALLATACGAAKTSSNPAPTGFGQFAVKLVDAPPAKASGVTQILVTIDQVTAHSTATGWVPIFPKDAKTPPLRVDLMKLQDSAVDLGFLDLPKGTTITQIRLHVDPAPADPNVVVVAGAADPIPLVVPSGSQSGIKIHGPWEIAECQATSVTLDFDGKNSIFTHPAKQGTEWILRPVIRVKLTETLDVGCAAPPAAPVPAPCTSDDQCPEGDKCLGPIGAMVCAGPPNAPCTVGGECISGHCDAIVNRCTPSGTGEPCFTQGQCLDQTCDLTAHTCLPGKTDEPCSTSTDCASASCSVVCAPPADALPAQSPCTADGQCLSVSCSEGFCAPSMQGGPCYGAADCDATSICIVLSGQTVGTCTVRAR